MCLLDKRVITTLKYSKHKVYPTIVNGVPVDTTKVPYIISIKEKAYKISGVLFVWKSLCGGSILTVWKALTAAHCFEYNNFYYKKKPELLIVVAGSTATDLIHSGKTTIHPQVRRITKLNIRRDYNYPMDDLAVITVNSKWVFNDVVNFIKLASFGNRTIRIDSCVVSGFGKTGQARGDLESPVLLQAPINVLTRQTCTDLWEMDMDTFVCSDSYGDVAPGDSGGPLACQAYPKTKDRGEILVGVVSGKNFDKTTLYTRVSAYRKWIDRQVNKSGAYKLSPSITVIISLLCFITTMLL